MFPVAIDECFGEERIVGGGHPVDEVLSGIIIAGDFQGRPTEARWRNVLLCAGIAGPWHFCLDVDRVRLIDLRVVP